MVIEQSAILQTDIFPPFGRDLPSSCQGRPAALPARIDEILLALCQESEFSSSRRVSTHFLKSSIRSPVYLSMVCSVIVAPVHGHWAFPPFAALHAHQAKRHSCQLDPCHFDRDCLGQEQTFPIVWGLGRAPQHRHRPMTKAGFQCSRLRMPMLPWAENCTCQTCHCKCSSGGPTS